MNWCLCEPLDYSVATTLQWWRQRRTNEYNWIQKYINKNFNCSKLFSEERNNSPTHSLTHSLTHQCKHATMAILFAYTRVVCCCFFEQCCREICCRRRQQFISSESMTKNVKLLFRLGRVRKGEERRARGWDRRPTSNHIHLYYIYETFWLLEKYANLIRSTHKSSGVWKVAWNMSMTHNIWFISEYSTGAENV